MTQRLFGPSRIGDTEADRTENIRRAENELFGPQAARVLAIRNRPARLASMRSLNCFGHLPNVTCSGCVCLPDCAI
jgi:hypothetical protein